MNLSRMLHQEKDGRADWPGQIPSLSVASFQWLIPRPLNASSFPTFVGRPYRRSLSASMNHSGDIAGGRESGLRECAVQQMAALKATAAPIAVAEPDPRDSVAPIGHHSTGSRGQRRKRRPGRVHQSPGWRRRSFGVLIARGRIAVAPIGEGPRRPFREGEVASARVPGPMTVREGNRRAKKIVREDPGGKGSIR